MNKRILVSAITAATLAIGSASALADPRAPRGDERNGAHKHQVDKRHRHDARDHRRHDARDHRRHDARDDRRHGPANRVIVHHGKPAHVHVHHHRGAGPRRDLYRGHRLPAHYHTTHYVVNDWRAHRLSPPPRDHRWVRVGADYALIAIATGVITNLILAN